jgi:ribosome biogenesis protein BMS1
MSEPQPQTNKPHRNRKTKERKKHDNASPNPKAFAFAKPGKLQRAAARSHDKKEKRLHVPLVDRIPEDPPPLVVAVVGPPGVGLFPTFQAADLTLLRLAKQH